MYSQFSHTTNVTLFYENQVIHKSEPIRTPEKVPKEISAITDFLIYFLLQYGHHVFKD